MENLYIGIYGIGEKDSEGNLYLGLTEDLTLVREIAKNGTYHVGIIDESNENEHTSLLENISLRGWREFFVEIQKPEKIKELRKILRDSEEISPETDWGLELLPEPPHLLRIN